MTIRTYMDLEAWQEGIALALEVYRCTDGFPAMSAMEFRRKCAEQPYPFLATSPRDNANHGRSSRIM